MKASILIVEDQESVAENIKVSLKLSGYDVLEMLSSGEEALATVRLHKPDLILMDINLAGEMTGIETANQIQREFNIPIVYLTGETNPTDKVVADSYGYLRKPFNRAELQSMVRTALNRHRVEMDLAQARQREVLAYELGQQLITLLDPTKLVSEVVNRLLDTFGYYHVQIYLLELVDDPTGGKKEVLFVKNSQGEAGDILAREGHQISLDAERSLVARAARLRQPVAVNDVAQAPDHLPNVRLPKTHSEVAMPLVLGGKLIGVLDVQDKKVDHFDDGELRTLQIIANQLSVALSNAQLFAANARKTERLEALRNIDQALLAAHSPSAIARAALTHIQKLIPYQEADVMELDLEKRQTTLLAQIPTTSADVKQHLSLQGLEAVLTQLEAGQVVTVTQTEKPASAPLIEQLFRQQRITACIILPLRAQGRLIGVLNFCVVQLSDFTEEEYDIAHEVADVLAIALQQAQQRQALETAKEMYQSLFNGIPIGLYRTTPSGQILDANPALVELLGYTNRDELLAINLGHTYVSEDERNELHAIVNENNIAHNVEVRLRRADGTLLWARHSVSVVRDDDGQILYYEGALVD